MEKVRRAVFVLTLGVAFVLALGVLFSAQNVGSGQEVNGKRVNCVKETVTDPDKPKNVEWVCGIYGTKGTTATPSPTATATPSPTATATPSPTATPTPTGTDTGWPYASIPDKIKGTDNKDIVDKIEGYAGDDKLYGRGGWNGLIGDPGQDTLVGGPSRDWIFAVDGVDPEGTFAPVGSEEVDTIRCGGGKDTAYIDVKRDAMGTVVFPVQPIDNIAGTWSNPKDCEKLEWGEPSQIHWFRETKRKKHPKHH